MEYGKKKFQMTRCRKQIAVFLLATVILFALAFLTTGFQAVEDSYITFRYSANAAHGEGLVFNRGEKVEGYTNFLWMLIIALVGLIQPQWIPRGAVALELLFAASTLLVLWRWTQKAWPLLVLAVFPGFIDNVGTGLEASWLAFLVILGGYLVFEKGRYQAGSVVMGLLFATRPDGGLIGLLLLGGALWSGAGERGERKKNAVALFGPWFILVIGIELFRLLYYGELVPNTFYTKVGIDLHSDIRIGLQNLWDYIRFGGWAFLVVLFALLCPGAKRRQRFAVFATVSIYLLYYIYVGGPSGNQSRFLAPLIPLMIVFTGLLFEGMKKSFPGRAALFGVILFVAVASGVMTLLNQKAHLPGAEKVDNYELMSLAVSGLPEKSTIVFQAIGRVGWENRHLHFIDPLGLTSREVARFGEPHPEITIQGHRKWMAADQFFTASPDYYVPFSAGCISREDCSGSTVFKPRPAGPDSLVFRDQRFGQNYEAISLAAGGEGCVLAFKRK